MKSQPNAGIGIRVKRGMAIAIATVGGPSSPVFAGRAELLLSDPRIPSSLRPFHALARLPRKEALPAVERDRRLVCEAAAASVRQFIQQLKSAGHQARRAVIVSDRDPPKIDNPHLRAHADERRLFREAVAAAARRGGIATLFLNADELDARARTVGIPAKALAQWLVEIGAAAGRPWRSDEKAAAAASWIALALKAGASSPALSLDGNNAKT